jgi:hypothetical protein
MDTKVEIETADGIWDDISRFIAPYPPSHPLGSRGQLRRVMRSAPKYIGPRTTARLAAYAARVESLPLLRETYGPCANPTVAGVRAQTRLNERDRAERSGRGQGGTAPTHPNRRLAAFGIRVEVDESTSLGYRLVGGTARQQACYRRAVERWLTSDAIAEASA